MGSLRRMKWFVGLVCLTLGAWAHPETNGRSFSLFSVVQFPNDECTTTTSASMKGICKSSTECSKNGGVSSGNCASGFGVCCYYRVTLTNQAGGTANVIYNGTYIENENYPTASTKAASYAYTVMPKNFDGICHLRLDFEPFVVGAPSDAGVCTDKLTITSGSSLKPPVTCGTLTGSHMYVATGKVAKAATITLVTSGTTTSRTWRIRVQTIECNSASGPSPSDCLQYYTGTGGNLVSFNGGATAPQLIQSLNYKICMRKEAGFCSMMVSETDPADTTAPDSYHLDTTATVHVNQCTTACLNIGGNKYGGKFFGAMDNDLVAGTVRSNDFSVGVFTTATTQATASLFKLTYRLVPCQ